MRPRRPWFRASTRTWMTVIDGKRIPLAKGKENKAEAEQAYYRLMVDRGGIPAKPSDLTVAVLSDLFLDHSERNCAPDTFSWHKNYLQKFCEIHGRLKCRDVKPFHLSRWLDSHPSWTGARRSAQVIVKRVFSWAKGEGLIQENPLAHVKNPPVTRRERIVTTEERDQILEAIKDKAFHRFVRALFATGARPSEVASVTAKDIRFDLSVWVLKKHKTAAKTQKPRIIYLNPEMLELSKELAAAHPEGPIFRNKLGKPWTRNSWRCRFRRLRQLHPNLEGVVAYSLRHTFGTEALERGVPIASVAELMGHTDVKMTATYNHLSVKAAHLREAVAKATS